MKKLTIITIRKFPKEEDYQDYKAVCFLNIDWDGLENGESQVIDSHRTGELVKTTVSLNEELPVN